APPTVSIGDVALSEGDSGLTLFQFPVNLSAASGKPISLSFATSAGSATTGDDYAETYGTVNLSAGELSKTISVEVNGERIYEGNKKFFYTLSNSDIMTL